MTSNNSFFSARFREIHLLINKKLNSFVYKFVGFLNNSIRVYTIKLKIGLLYHMNNTFQNTNFQICIHVPLMETVSFNGSRVFQWKALLLQGKLILLVEAVPFSGSHSFQWKPFILRETIASSGRHSFQQKSFLIVDTILFWWKPFLVVEAIPFNVYGNYCPLWKTFFLVEAIPFSGSHSF